MAFENRCNSVAAVLAAAVAVLAGCTSDGSSDPVSGPATPSDISTTVSSSSSPSIATPTAAPSTTGFGIAQPAVDTMLQIQAQYAAAVRDTARGSTAKLDLLLAGQAKQAFDSSFLAAKKAGVVYKGTPPAARIKVTVNRTSDTVPQVVLVNCPLQSSKDPFVAYYAASGKPLPVPAARVKPPYAQTAKAFRVNGRWVVTQFSTDATKTCTA